MEWWAINQSVSIRVMIFFCLQISDAGSDELLHVNDEYHVFLLNITKTSRTRAPKKSYDSLKNGI